MWSALFLLCLTAAPRLEVHPAKADPGGLVVLDAWGTEAPLSGSVLGQDLHFFLAGPGHQRAFLALKLEQAPGAFVVQARAAADLPAEGAELSSTLNVAKKDFPRRELSVEGKFVNPPKKVKKQMEEDRAAIDAAYAVPFGPALFVGGLAEPRPGAAITAHFGDQRTYNGKKKSEHYGTDFEGKVGDRIQSAADGVVVLARGCYMSGNTVIVSHGGGLFTSYFHMTRMDVAPGDRVTQGQQLGVVGATGRVTGPHLHFGVKVFTHLVDAESALKLSLGLDPPPLENAPRAVLDGGVQDGGR
jgi:murein DD-endopeptidase MepM/ murein hydrolase activator NlpD